MPGGAWVVDQAADQVLAPSRRQLEVVRHYDRRGGAGLRAEAAEDAARQVKLPAPGAGRLTVQADRTGRTGGYAGAVGDAASRIDGGATAVRRRGGRRLLRVAGLHAPRAPTRAKNLQHRAMSFPT